MNKQDEITKENAISFLIQCYFGHIDDPILSAIDRAYLDMQTHTISGERNELHCKRKATTEVLYCAIKELNKSKPFDMWHKETAKAMKKQYKSLSYGQIQKWINMTIKYLYTLKLLGITGISEYFNSENSMNFHPALDSYVLNAVKKDVTWSKIEGYDTYNLMRKELTFAEEYKNWPQYAYNASLKKNGEKRIPEKGTYKRYVWDKGGYSFDVKNHGNKSK